MDLSKLVPGATAAAAGAGVNEEQMQQQKMVQLVRRLALMCYASTWKRVQCGSVGFEPGEEEMGRIWGGWI